MKKFFILLGLLAATTANSQPGTDQGTRESLEAQANRQLLQRLPAPKLERSNEVRRGKLTFSGIAVQLFKTDQPLQLINPAAPPEYGSGEQNTVYDPITGRASGLKVFSVEF